MRRLSHNLVITNPNQLHIVFGCPFVHEEFIVLQVLRHSGLTSDTLSCVTASQDQGSILSIMTDLVESICYEKALEYWSEVPATVDGGLGGFGFISDVDIQGSKLFLQSLLSSEKPPSTNLALDSGAGIGRITKYLLTPQFRTVDVVEPDEKFINTIREYVGSDAEKLGNLYKVSLQEFRPEKKYDVFWNQWVLGYLKDDDLLSYLTHCRNALSENGVIVVKENVSSSGKIEKDEADSSVTRPLKEYIKIFGKAKLKRIKQCKQTNFPNGIYPVYMFALVPNSTTDADSKDEKL